MYTLCGQNVELLNVKPDGTNSDHWALKHRIQLTKECGDKVR
jgi:hypothetical protein